MKVIIFNIHEPIIIKKCISITLLYNFEQISFYHGGWMKVRVFVLFFVLAFFNGDHEKTLKISTCKYTTIVLK